MVAGLIGNVMDTEVRLQMQEKEIKMMKEAIARKAAAEGLGDGEEVGLGGEAVLRLRVSGDGAGDGGLMETLSECSEEDEVVFDGEDYEGDGGFKLVGSEGSRSPQKISARVKPSFVGSHQPGEAQLATGRELPPGFGAVHERASAESDR